MAGIKISDLPPNTLPLVGDEQLELENADGDSTRATVADIIGSGGDVFKVGIPVNDQLAVWTGDGTLEGTDQFTLVGDLLRSGLGNGPGMRNISSTSATAPSLLPRHGDPNTGVANAGDDILALTAGGVGGMQLIEASGGVLHRFDAEVTLTAFAGGGQASATILHQSYNVVTTVASPGDSVKLSEATRVGMLVYVKNDGANALDLFPALTDDLGFGIGVAISVAAGQSVAFVGTVDNNTWTQLIFATGAAGGDVFKVGTPVDNQIGVWTGDGTIEGDPSFVFDKGTQTFGFGGTATIFSDAPLFSFQDGSVTLDGKLTTTPTLSISQSGINNFSIAIQTGQWVFSGNVPISAFNVSGNVVRWEFEGIPVRIIGGGGTDYVEQSHDNTDYNFDAFQTVDINFTGLSGRIKQDAETLAFLSEITGVPDPLLLSDGSAAAPSYSFTSDTDIGMFRVGADILGLSARSTLIAQAVGAVGANQFVVAPGAIQNNQSAPDLGFGDGNTGVMQTAEDIIALIAGGNQAVRYAEISAQIVQINNNQTGLTASVTQTQAGGLALLSSYNEIATVATTGDALTSFPVLEGARLTVVNNGVNDLQLFPAIGDDFGAGVDASITIAAGEVGIFLGRDSTNWDVLFSGSAAGGDVFKVGTPVDNEIGVWTGNGTLEGDTNFEWTGAQLIIGVAGTAALPAIAFGDGDSGFMHSPANVIRVSLSGVSRFFWEVDSFNTEVSTGGAMLNVASGALIPTFVPRRGDPNTGLASAGLDILTFPVGGVEALRLAEVSSRIIQTNANHVGLTASVTQTQGGGLTLLSSYNEVATVANSGDALTAFDVAEGSRLTVVNNGANDLQLFPASGDDFGAGVDASITILASQVAVFLGRTAVAWDVLKNGPPEVVDNDAVQARRTTTLTLTLAFVDVTLDATDVESDAAVIEHDAITDRIVVKETGTYEILYQFNINTVTGTNSGIIAEGRVRLNDAGTGIAGSLAETQCKREHGNPQPSHLTCKFIVDLTAADFVTLQVQKTDIKVTEAYFIDETSLQVTRLL